MSDEEPHNLKYSLADGKIVSRPATLEEIASARDEARAKMPLPSGWSMRSCWVCNPAHRYFLDDTNDGFLFGCVMGCGRFYYNGIDITEYDDPEKVG